MGSSSWFEYSSSRFNLQHQIWAYKHISASVPEPKTSRKTWAIQVWANPTDAYWEYNFWFVSGLVITGHRFSTSQIGIGQLRYHWVPGIEGKFKSSGLYVKEYFTLILQFCAGNKWTLCSVLLFTFISRRNWDSLAGAAKKSRKPCPLILPTSHQQAMENSSSNSEALSSITVIYIWNNRYFPALKMCQFF